MCGIIGYIGDKEVGPILIDGLKRLEYRGYDSAGFCILHNNNLDVIKKPGKISEFIEFGLKDIKGTRGIAHTRWATHGAPNEINAHPHVDCKNEIAIVHNGIIENYVALKDLLKTEGHKIISDTDSEILAHLIEKFYNGDIEDAVSKALKLVEGTFGLLVMHKNEEKMIAARKGSPLILGVGDNEMLISSDAAAILKYTKRVIYLHDNEIAAIGKNNYSVKNLEGESVDKKIHEIKWDIGHTERSSKY